MSDEFDVNVLWEWGIILIVVVALIVASVLAWHYKGEYQARKTYEQQCTVNPSLRYQTNCGTREECIQSCIKQLVLNSSG